MDFILDFILEIATLESDFTFNFNRYLFFITVRVENADRERIKMFDSEIILK